MLIFCSIIIIICASILLLIQFLPDEQELADKEIEDDLMELMQKQNELNNAAFSARKALIEEALNTPHIKKQSRSHKET